MWIVEAKVMAQLHLLKCDCQYSWNWVWKFTLCAQIYLIIHQKMKYCFNSRICGWHHDANFGHVTYATVIQACLCKVVEAPWGEDWWGSWTCCHNYLPITFCLFKSSCLVLKDFQDQTIAEAIAFRCKLYYLTCI